MTQRFFTSDTHKGHKLVARERGFVRPETEGVEFDERTQSFRLIPDPDAHDAYLAAMWDRTVRPDDEVFVLGDISINPKRENAFEWFRERPGKKHLISGNHDETNNMFSRSLNAQQNALWRDTFATINDWTRLKIAGQTVILSHYPYEGEGDRDIEDRHPEYRFKDSGFPLLHGHTHDKVQYHLSAAGSHQMHVGLDAWGLELVPEETVVEWLSYLPR